MSTEKITLDITGMTCDNCAANIKKILSTLPGITAEISFQKGEALIEINDNTPINKITETIKLAGFEATQRSV